MVLSDGVSLVNTLRACGYKLLDYPQTSRTGEGTGVLFRHNLTVKKGATAELRSFEYSEWDIKSETDQIHLIIVYRTPDAHPGRHHNCLSAAFDTVDHTILLNRHYGACVLLV